MPGDRIRVNAENVEHGLAGIKLDANDIIDNAEVLVPNLRALLAELSTEEKTLVDILGKHEVAGRTQRIALLLRLAKFGIVTITPPEGAEHVKRGPSDPQI